MASNLPKPSHGKSLSEQFREGITFIIIGSFILYYIGMFFEFLFRPLLSSGSAKETEKRLRDKIRQKQIARETKRAFYKNDVNDPIYQFKLRFIEKPDKYKNDPDTQIYNDWFQEWKNGNILDSDLRWAPDVYDDSNEIRKNFIDYMKIQFNLHKKESFFKRFIFIKTISKYYPEFTASMSGLEEDLYHYDSEITKNNLQRQLRKEINKYGLPDEISEYIIEKDFPANDLEKIAKTFKKYIERDISLDCSIYVFENNITDMDEIRAINDFTEETGLPYRVGLAYLKGQINNNSVERIIKLMSLALESYGPNIFDYIPNEHTTPYDGFIDEYLKEEKEKCKANFFNQKG